jgi:hypothetical protein
MPASSSPTAIVSTLVAMGSNTPRQGEAADEEPHRHRTGYVYDPRHERVGAERVAQDAAGTSAEKVQHMGV